MYLGFLMPGYATASYTPPSATIGDIHAATEQVERDVTRRIESLELACAGLWELLKQKNGYTDQEIVEAIRKVDMLDGKLDGRVQITDQTCPKCGHKLLSRKSPKCSWCGADLPRAPF